MNFRFSKPVRTISAALFLLTTLTTGCAFEPGAPWGYIESSLSLDDEHLHTPPDFTIDSIQLTVRTIRLYTNTSSGGGGNTPFDPANPPPGYAQCHGGHCHAEDGSLPTYAEVEAATSGQNSTTQTLATSANFHATLTPTRELSSELKILQRATLTSAEVEFTELHIHGTLQRADTSHPLTISIPLNAARISSPIHLTVDRDSLHHQTLPLLVELPHDLLESINLDTLATQANGSITISPIINATHATALTHAFEHHATLAIADDHDHHNHDDHHH